MTLNAKPKENGNPKCWERGFERQTEEDESSERRKCGNECSIIVPNYERDSDSESQTVQG